MFSRSLQLTRFAVVLVWLPLLGCETETPIASGVSGAAGQFGGVAGATGVAGGSGASAQGGSLPAGAGTGGAGTGGAVGAAGQGGAGGDVAGGGSAGVGGVAGAAGNVGSAGSGGAPPVVLDEALRQRVVAGMVPLQALYHTDTGLFDKNDWWTSGNELEAVIDYTRETGDQQYVGDIENTFVKNEKSNFDRHGFYDDDGWWAIVWIKAYDLRHEQKYLDMAKTIFARMASSWDTKCGGGIYWRNQKDKKNAIPNSLFMQTAAKLHQRTPGDAGAGSYLDWAKRTWTWFNASGMITANKQVVDTLNNLTECKAEGPVFTYNNGTLVGALVELAASSGDQSMLDEAGAIARATMTLMADNGTLKEPGCGGDVCTQFKGIFLRNLLLFYRARPAKDLQQYMRHQSDTLWNVSRNAKNEFGYEWHLPFDNTGSAGKRQSSALDALTAAFASSSPLP
jgi:predicted alpha-1,6-mannanase (GH76 family)